ncbi:glycerophosphodiester phosphodiesterase family protein [Agromyces aerolatus]|uniref:glycerophosphodiester phosphodiesterase family protein n=1 Tax=Agromyces sp. LY-1074 TaxID=3074080 RepID=UPI0028651644|nr:MULTISPECIES: glycerophosphodiester phosphodiesterase family protein [unclassified Agromyces]MDR5698318.1 glycerophosphodiester phosphodiesterase family protein [Agromyces sp. LY-1074]MDR5704612.1 glycerophosphodiester phosphodiesterase family protein [Agromyces sp. LY-1358]
MLGDSAEHPLVIGHRGAPGYRPEHTSASYELAFALGADAVEPDLVATRDGVLVLRHENEISGTTDVSGRPEFAGRRTTREVDGRVLTGWFTEDFTWAELATLRATERLGALRPLSASFDGRFPIIRLRDLFEIVDRAASEHDRMLRLVAEFKHATHFAGLGLPLDDLFAAELEAAGWGSGDERLIMESFEPTLLDRLAERGLHGRRVFLLEDAGAPWDLTSAGGRAALRYDHFATEAGLLALAGRFDGVSVGKARLLAEPRTEAVPGRPLTGAELVDAAHSAGLEVYTWTLRPENRFLAPGRRRGAARAGIGDWPGEFRQIIGTGVDGLFLDHPDLGVAVRGAAYT